MQEWEVTTPAKEKTFCLDQPDLFKMKESLKTELQDGVLKFYRDLLQIDNKLNGDSPFSLEQDFKHLIEPDSKFGWHVICVTMPQIKQLITFFKVNFSKSNKGVSNLIDKIEFYDEEENILTEKQKDIQFLKEKLVD